MWKKGIVLVTVLAASTIAYLTLVEKDVEKNLNYPTNESYPEDFKQIVRDIQRGTYYSLDKITPEFYLKKDFYSTYKTCNYNTENHDYTRWIPYGYGAFPGEIGIGASMKVGQYLDSYVFIIASCGAETFQGLKLSLSSPNETLFETIVEPDTLLLGPTFPEFSTDPPWAYKIKITVVAKQDVPPGNYRFKLYSSHPDAKKDKEFYDRVYSLTNLKYYDCPLYTKCEQETVELRRKAYVASGWIAPDKFHDVVINVQ